LEKFVIYQKTKAQLRSHGIRTAQYFHATQVILLLQ
jgi:hypothetical protein